MSEPLMSEPLVLAFADARAESVFLAGGKGASLARMARAGFPVPDGVVVTAACYRAFTAAWPELEERAQTLPVADPEALRRACTVLREELLRRPFPVAVEEALREALPEAVSAGPVSVRSSATLEDLAGAAFAGQHDSFLGVSGAKSALEHVKRCWASLWEDRAVRYRHEQGFGITAADMAVVVQEMVDADVAGVTFSINPITGEVGRILVTGAWGLGETVVSGEGEVDQWVIDKATREVVESRLGHKTHAIHQTPGGGTEHTDVPEDRRSAPCLTHDELQQLATLVLKVERHCAFPQDVEWAVRDSEVYLLQSRPVTELPARWTRQESAERFPNPITPLTWDFTTPGFHESLAHSLDMMGMPPFDGEWFTRLDGYIYGNQTAVEVFAAGHQAAFDDLDDLTARVPALREGYRWVQELPVHWARDLDRYLLRLGRLGARNLAGLSLGELWAHVLEIDRVGREYFLPNIAISITQGLLHRLLFQMVAHVVGPTDAPAVYDGLTCFCDTKTGLVNRDLYELACMVQNDKVLRRRLVEGDRRTFVQSGEMDAFPEFEARFQRFLEIHGHREVDFDAYVPTWSGQPWVVLENLRLIVMRDKVEEPGLADQERRSRQQVTEREFLSGVPSTLRTFAGEIIRLARTYTALDDLEHYQTTRLTPPFRAAVVEMGRRLVDAGGLDEPEDVFFLRRDTLEGVVVGRVTMEDARCEARNAKEDHRRHAESEPPFRWGVEDEVEDHEGRLNGPNGRGSLSGLPGAPGVAEGPVCLVHSADDFARFTPGSVLVARTTNPAWTPLFYSAAAVVTESGGPLSHGAVTAREVRIPAVMAVRGALGQLADGVWVRVDGTRGTVTLCEGSCVRSATGS